MSVNDYVLVQGMKDTRSALVQWRREPGVLLERVFAGSLAIAVTLLIGVWAAASLLTPDVTTVTIPGSNTR